MHSRHSDADYEYHLLMAAIQQLKKFHMHGACNAASNEHVVSMDLVPVAAAARPAAKVSVHVRSMERP